MQAPPDRITLEVARSDATRPSTFDVPVASRASRVLDALLYVREHLDPTLRFRYACRNGMCGSCAVVVNGREALSCQTAIAALGTSNVHVAPLRGLPVQGDLVCDMTPFFDTFRRSDAALRPADPSRSTPRVMPPAEPRRAMIERHNGCITCGACDSACASMMRPSPGPAALNRVLMLSEDERDTKGPARLRGIGDGVRALRQGDLSAIDDVCPANIPLCDAIAALDARGSTP
ncbi:MAG TPA: 2Fe-2S iron-sulfur cluster-binding protein [Casimicrobiaceae bacterium]|nr:2Fe-2S iron-sulfur cluster-binding protein [Casimicrobiaceae bacterium]